MIVHEQLRCATFREPCWGYHFDVQTRVFFYPRSAPNTIATAFAGLGLLDAWELRLATSSSLKLAAGVGDFFIGVFCRRSARKAPFSDTSPVTCSPIHNANMVVSAFACSPVCESGDERFVAPAARRSAHPLDQRPDGSSAIRRVTRSSAGRRPSDGLCVGLASYVFETGVGGENAKKAWRRGLEFYAGALI